MASNRHLGRIVALQTLYELDFRSSGLTEISAKEILKRNLKPYKKQIGDIDFVTRVTNGVLEDAEQIDKIIGPIAPEWPVDQIARIDKIILRIALWELQNEKDTPSKVVINEAVELAKSFGSESSSKFVNGVLGTAFKELFDNQKDINKD